MNKFGKVLKRQMTNQEYNQAPIKEIPFDEKPLEENIVKTMVLQIEDKITKKPIINKELEKEIIEDVNKDINPIIRTSLFQSKYKTTKI